MLGIVTGGFFVPEPTVIPVKDAAPRDWNKESFWYEPWGSSGVHKGIDIFADKTQPVLSATHGIVVYRGELEKGGKVVAVLGPAWRLHYYAHLHTIEASAGAVLTAGDILGTVGNTGNAAGKSPHLHYTVINLIPRPWHMDDSTQGYKKAWFVDPGRYLLSDS